VSHLCGRLRTCVRSAHAFEARMAADTLVNPGGVAQSGRAPAWHAGGSWVRAPSPPLLPELFEFVRSVGFTLGGLVAGEGSFTTVRQRRPYRDGSPRLKFVFRMTMARRDLPLLEALRSFLGYGSIPHHERGRAHWQPTSTLRIHSIWAHGKATIPFAEEFLLPCGKRRQYVEWRDRLIAYDKKRVRPCTVEGCDKPRRAHGLCRQHLYSRLGI
jgi:hypothetical protein